MRTAYILVALTMSICLTNLTAHAQDNKKKAPLTPLPSGPTGPLPQMPLDLMSPVSPQVIYHNGELTIVAPNSTLSDILRCVRDQTEAEIEIPAMNERVVTRLGPGPVRDVLAELLNGSHFNYVLLGSPADGNGLTRVVLLAKTEPDVATPVQPGMLRRVIPGQEPRRPNQDLARVNNQGGITNQVDLPAVQEVTPPPIPGPDGSVEVTD